MRPRIVQYLLDHGINVYVPDYTVIVLTAIILTTFLTFRSAIRLGYPKRAMLIVIVSIVVFVIAGARIYGVLSNLQKYQAMSFFKALIAGRETGSFGAWAGFIIGTTTLTVLFKLNTFRIMDVTAPFLGLSIFIGRTGCFMSGCCYGTITSFPVSVSFPSSSVVYFKHRAEGLLSPYAELSLPVHPIQLYESLFGLVLFIFIRWVRNHANHDGTAIFSLFASYTLFRFMLEFIRANDHLYLGYFSLAQVLYLGLFIISIIGMIWTYKRAKTPLLIKYPPGSTS